MSANTIPPRSETIRRHASKLAHDVGKYIARIARNLPEGDIPDHLIALMEKDLYAIDGRQPASRRFETLVRPLAALATDPRIDDCRKRLAEIDALRGAIGARDPDAVRRAAALALEVEKMLTAFHRDIAQTPA